MEEVNVEKKVEKVKNDFICFLLVLTMYPSKRMMKNKLSRTTICQK